MRYLILVLLASAAWGQAWYPTIPNGMGSNAAISAQTIDATGEKVSFIGHLWSPGGASKSIRKIGFGFGSTIVKAGGSALTVSLQDVSTTAGPPAQPDGAQDQTVAVPSASITASAFLMTAALSADRAVSFGDLLSVVIEFDGAGRLGSDSVQIATLQAYTQSYLPSTSVFTASWADAARMPIIVFEFSDGTYGTLDGAQVFSAFNTSVVYNSGSANDENALRFTAPSNGVLDGVRLSLTAATGADFDIVLYAGTTALASVSVDQNTYSPTASGGAYFTFPPTTLTAGSVYFLSVKPTTTNNVTLAGATVASNAYLGATPQGIEWYRAQRVDGGAWTTTNTIVPNINFRFTPTASAGMASGAYVVAQ